MSLIRCKECKKEYSDSLEACPHCGYVRPRPIVCLTCGETYYGPQKICSSCGFPVNEDHSRSYSTKETIISQKKAYEAEVSHVEELKVRFRIKLEAARDQRLASWKEEFEEEIIRCNAEMSKHQGELSKLGALAFGKKKQLRMEIEALEASVSEYSERLSELADARKRMDAIIKKECKDASANTYAAALKKYLSAFKNELERDNNDRNRLRAEVKDRVDLLLAESDHPVEIRKLIDEIWSRYPEYKGRVAGYFKDSCRELVDEGRIEIVAKTGWDALLITTRRFHNIPQEPDIDEVLNPLAEDEKLAYVKAVMVEKGDQYNEYMNELASSLGWREVRDYYVKVMNQGVQREVLSSMSLAMSAKAAVDNSMKSSAAIAGGAVSALAGPVAGVMVAYHTAQENQMRDIKRKKAEMERDAYFFQHERDAALASAQVVRLYLLDYDLLLKR